MFVPVACSATGSLPAGWLPHPASGDAGRIRGALAELRELTKGGDELDLPAIEPWLLQPFGDPPPAEAVLDLARLLARYRSFVPPPSRAHVVRQLVELAVRYAVPQVIHETSIEIQGQDDPAATAREPTMRLTNAHSGA